MLNNEFYAACSCDSEGDEYCVTVAIAWPSANLYDYARQAAKYPCELVGTPSDLVGPIVGTRLGTQWTNEILLTDDAWWIIDD